MGRALGLVSAALVALAFRYIHGDAAPYGGVDLLGLSLTTALAALIASGVSDLVETMRQDEPMTKSLFDTLVLRNLLFAGVIGWFVSAVAITIAGPYQMSNRGVQAQYASVALLAAAVAYGELISRYRDAPGRLLAADPTVVYLCVNIAASISALALVKEFKAVTSTDHRAVYEVLLAGFGAIAFFRTSLFTIRVSGSDIGVGPSTLLKALLDSSDMMVNRWQAQIRGAQVRSIMTKVDFEKAWKALPATCFTLMTEFPAAVQTSVGEQITKLAADKDIPTDAKTIILGIYMIQQVGADVLDRSVRTLAETIEVKPSSH